MRIKPFQAVYPNLDYISSPASFFETVKYEYVEYTQSGFFQKAAQEALYIYQIKGAERTYTGLIACADIREFREGHIKKHEKTLASKEQQQIHLMLSRNAVVKPVMLTYPKVRAIENRIQAFITETDPFYSVVFEETGELHALWEVSSGPLIRKIQTLFETKVPDTYIADGHHRTSTMALMHERMKGKKEDGRFDYLLCAFFPAGELDIHDYNRVIEGLNDCTLTTFMARISNYFHIEVLEEARKPTKKHELVMLINKEWYLLKWKQEVLDSHADDKVILDATLLNEKVLQEILGIEDVRTDQRIKYVEGPKGLEGLRIKTMKNESRVAFCLYPVELKDLMLLADEEQTLPPKSTWFEPRIKNGLIVQEI